MAGMAGMDGAQTGEPSDAGARSRGQRSPSTGRARVRGQATAADMTPTPSTLRRFPGSATPTPAPGPERGLNPTRLPMVFSPSFDPSDLAVRPGLGQRLATFNAEVATAVNLLSDTVEGLAGRIVGVEMAHRTLADGAQAALLEVLSQARAEFQAQGSSLLALRAEVQEEMVEFRGYLLETRGVLEQLYEGSRGEFAALQQAVGEAYRAQQEDRRRLEHTIAVQQEDHQRLEGLIFEAHMAAFTPLS